MKDAVIVTNERGSKFEVAANGKSHEVAKYIMYRDRADVK